MGPALPWKKPWATQSETVLQPEALSGKDFAIFLFLNVDRHNFFFFLKCAATESDTVGRDQEIPDLLLLGGAGISLSLKFVGVFVEGMCSAGA